MNVTDCERRQRRSDVVRLLRHDECDSVACYTTVGKDGRKTKHTVKKWCISRKSDAEKRYMVKGLTALSMLSHENVVAYVDSWESDNYIYLMTEFCENGNFYDYVLRHVTDESSIKYARWLLDISRALQYIHGRGIIHRNIKPTVIMVGRNSDSHTVLKLGEFRIPKVLEFGACGTQSVVGTAGFVSPERLEGHMYDTKTDIWSLGVCFTYLINDQFKSCGQGSHTVIGNSPSVKEHYNPIDEIKPKSCSESLAKIIKTMTSDDPLKRPTADMLVNQLTEYLKTHSHSDTRAAAPATPPEKNTIKVSAREKIEVKREKTVDKCEKIVVRQDKTKVKREKIDDKCEKIEVHQDKTGVKREKIDDKCEKLEVKREKTDDKCEKIEVHQDKTGVKREKIGDKCEKIEVKREKTDDKCDKLEVHQDKTGVKREKIGDKCEKIEVKREKIGDKCEKIEVHQDKTEIKREKTGSKCEKIRDDQRKTGMKREKIGLSKTFQEEGSINSKNVVVLNEIAEIKCMKNNNRNLGALYEGGNIQREGLKYEAHLDPLNKKSMSSKRKEIKYVMSDDEQFALPREKNNKQTQKRNDTHVKVQSEKPDLQNIRNVDMSLVTGHEKYVAHGQERSKYVKDNTDACVQVKKAKSLTHTKYKDKLSKTERDTSMTEPSLGHSKESTKYSTPRTVTFRLGIEEIDEFSDDTISIEPDLEAANNCHPTGQVDRIHHRIRAKSPEQLSKTRSEATQTSGFIEQREAKCPSTDDQKGRRRTNIFSESESFSDTDEGKMSSGYNTCSIQSLANSHHWSITGYEADISALAFEVDRKRHANSDRGDSARGCSMKPFFPHGRINTEFINSVQGSRNINPAEYETIPDLAFAIQSTLVQSVGPDVFRAAYACLSQRHTDDVMRDLRNALGDKYKENGSLFLVLGEIDKVL